MAVGSQIGDCGGKLYIIGHILSGQCQPWALIGEANLGRLGMQTGCTKQINDQQRSLAADDPL